MHSKWISRGWLIAGSAAVVFTVALLAPSATSASPLSDQARDSAISHLQGHMPEGPFQETSVAPAWRMLAAGYEHTCGILNDGTAWCWGYNSFGQIGRDPDTVGFRTKPVQVGVASDWVTIEAGEMLTCGTRADHTIWCWGYANAGGEGFCCSGLQQIGADTGDWATVAVDQDHQCGILTDGSAWCWGNNYRGALGNGTQNDSAVPVPVAGNGKWLQVIPFEFSTCGIRTDHSLWCWGWNADGELGLGKGVKRSTIPRQVGKGTDWVVLDGDTTVCGTRTTGALWCWGWNSYGTVGDGTSKNVRWRPVEIGARWSWLSARPGATSTCGLVASRRMKCWGQNADYEFGNGTDHLSLTPTPGAGDKWRQLVRNHGIPGYTCGIRRDGAGYCWGAGGMGQLGNGDRKSKKNPTLIKWPGAH